MEGDIEPVDWTRGSMLVAVAAMKKMTGDRCGRRAQRAE
jgi:hypothetical protein